MQSIMHEKVKNLIVTMASYDDLRPMGCLVSALMDSGQYCYHVVHFAVVVVDHRLRRTLFADLLEVGLIF
jgi:hypothetical protein